jgi:hypothetical protein
MTMLRFSDRACRSGLAKRGVGKPREAKQHFAQVEGSGTANLTSV